MGKILGFILSLTVLAAAVCSCNTTGCLENQNSLPLAGFYSMDTKSAISIDSISIGGVNAPDDSLLVNNGKGVSSVYLPFRAARQSSSFFIHYEQEALSSPEFNDTITFDYTSFPVFVSEECGAMYHYTITHTSYTRHLIDSVSVTDAVITNVEKERIKIFFRTAEQDEGNDDADDSDTGEVETDSDSQEQDDNQETTE